MDGEQGSEKLGSSKGRVVYFITYIFYREGPPPPPKKLGGNKPQKHTVR